ncbi:MAG TPA: zinc-binding alcohol dehydrogenase family protein [Steroidobacteraceae bacterium]|nr:zinc-binding alcohol dehydrogenase family protein [Steroidobacteraceae bacterium]
MKAVGLYRHLPIDDPESLVDLDVPKPAPAARELLVEVKAISVNPVDYKVRLRAAPGEQLPRILGWDVAGVVSEVGPAVQLFKPGDEVYYAGSIHKPGANSECHVVDERIVGRKPRTLSFAAAAALPLTTLTAWEGLFDRLGIASSGANRGATVLLIGAAGGVGSIAIQLAKQLGGLRVIATASRPQSARWVRELGADAVVDHTGDLAEQMKAQGVAEADYVFCLTDATPYFPRFAPIMRAQGKLCLIVSHSAPVELTALMQKSISVHWEYMFTRSLFATEDMQRQHEILQQTAALIDSGALRTTLGENLGAINAMNLRRAHQLLERGHTVGKLVLEGFE